MPAENEADPDLVALDEALESLARERPRQAELVKLRYFAVGTSILSSTLFTSSDGTMLDLQLTTTPEPPLVLAVARCGLLAGAAVVQPLRTAKAVKTAWI